MSTEKNPEDQITEAGAVELDESQLDDASGGIIAIAPSPGVRTAIIWKYPEIEIDPIATK